MSEFSYQEFRRRRTETLAFWWHELNRWRWPKGIHEPAEAKIAPGRPRRKAFMDALAMELGYRKLRECGRKPKR